MKLSLLMYTLETSVASRSSSNPWMEDYYIDEKKKKNLIKLN